MADVFSVKKRSEIMRSIHGKDTKPEMIVRKLVFKLGFRYRLHVKKLPGNPDLVFPSKKKIIFVHGCYWHRHNCKKGRSLPSTNVGFWSEKLERNRKRDIKKRRELKRIGWKILVIWECQAHSAKMKWLTKRIVNFLEE